MCMGYSHVTIIAQTHDGKVGEWVAAYVCVWRMDVFDVLVQLQDFVNACLCLALMAVAG